MTGREYITPSLNGRERYRRKFSHRSVVGENELAEGVELSRGVPASDPH
jgi:hypothetical protein